MRLPRSPRPRRARLRWSCCAATWPPTSGPTNFRINQHGAVESVGAAAERVLSPRTVRVDVARAYRRAEVERRPVVLMMPMDMQAEPVPADALPLPARSSVPVATVPAPGAVADVADLVTRRGALSSWPAVARCTASARDALETLGARIGALERHDGRGEGLLRRPAVRRRHLRRLRDAVGEGAVPRGGPGPDLRSGAEPLDHGQRPDVPRGRGGRPRRHRPHGDHAPPTGERGDHRRRARDRGRARAELESARSPGDRLPRPGDRASARRATDVAGASRSRSRRATGAWIPAGSRSR